MLVQIPGSPWSILIHPSSLIHPDSSRDSSLVHQEDCEEEQPEAERPEVHSLFDIEVSWHDAPCLVRRKYPKCTVYAASDEHPKGFKSVDDSFSWPQLFMERLSNHFGTSWFCQQLKGWNWSMSTAFSGIGAPENVGNSIL